MEKRQIESIQGLRGLTIIFIFLSHWGTMQICSMPDMWINRLYGGGEGGVSLFLIISGFVITLGHIDKEKKESGLVFWWNHIKKILPIHWVTLLVCICLWGVGDIRKLVCNFFLLQSLIPNNEFYFSYNMVTWYLSVTSVLYFLSPFFIKILKKIRKMPTGLILFLLCGLYFFEIFYSMFLWDNSIGMWQIYICPFFRAIDYFSGGILAILFLDRNDAIKKERNSLKFSTLEFCCLILMCITMWGFYRVNIIKYIVIFFWPMGMISVWIIAQGKGIFSNRLLERGIFNKIGDMSFEIFMWHHIVLRILRNIKWVNINIWTNLIWAIVLTGILSVFSYVMLDFRKKRKRKEKI